MSGDATIKCVLVGDDRAGKTSLLHTFADGRRPSLPPESLCSLPQMVHVTLHHMNTAYDLQLVDTAGGTTQLRSRLTAYSAYRDAGVVVLCADLTEPAAWPRLEADWRVELEQYASRAPFLLVGTTFGHQAADFWGLDAAGGRI
ncbi:rho-related GTP-binding protein RhoQ-like [Pollicipes pollicipes]|uniref:rho-related GTP-binding protein RhoQ-like n=1 Tax=Pollicipes pollicipes TaxID=41117 RepID=UPI0018851093|nr:rho-related GTP-binding protein RhoQ-like [Pollicipes pollicipes]